MDPILFFYLSSTESEEDEKIIRWNSREKEQDEKIARRKLRDKSNPLALSNKAFLKRFRLTKEAFEYVLQHINLKYTDTKAVPPILQLAVTLSLLASGGYQRSIGSDYLVGMCQSTVSKLVSRVLLEIENKLCPKHIRFVIENASECKEWFECKYKIPGVIGCVGGTHIELQKPTTNDHMFLNRKGYHSINALMVCDHTCKILAINCKYGGAAPNSLVWKHSDQRRVFQERFERDKLKNSWLLGNSAYPLEPWCITPYRNPSIGSSECIFNEVHSKARHVIRQTFDILKGRWKILGSGKRGRYEPTKVASFANACAALHNICIQFKISYSPRNFESDQTREVVPDETNQFTTMGQIIRDQLKNSLLNAS